MTSKIILRVILGFLLTFSLLGYLSNPVHATVPNSSMQTDLVRAESYLDSYKNDSALFIIEPLVAKLKLTGNYDDNFGIRVQLAEAIALEQQEKGDAAILKLLRVVELSKFQKMGKIHAKACLALELLYEKIGKKERALKYLDEARNSIERYKLDSIYPYFAIRMASWQRIFNSKEEALFYAREALRTAPGYNLKLEEAISHMLMNMLLPVDDFKGRLSHSLKAITLYRELEDYTGCSYMYSAIANLYFKKDNLPLALAYNDSSILFARQSIAAGHKKHRSIHHMYSLRGDIYKALGNIDSAWFYKDKGNQLKLKTLEDDISNKVIETESRYTHEKKQREIEAQKMALRLRNVLLAGALVILTIMVLLVYFLYRNYRRQQASQRVLIRQNSLIRKQTEQLKNLDLAKSRFFANVSHELRTPLTLMLGPIGSLLKDSQLTERQHNLLHIASNGGLELSNLVNEILDLVKMESGKMVVACEPTLVVSFFETCFVQFESLAQKKGLHYSFDYHPDSDRTVLIDRKKCRQLIYNLLSNALKFSSENGSIRFFLKIENDRLHLRVSDTGRGIHPEDLPYVFDPYFQTNQPQTVAGGGTGIGLTICREYARLFGGNISVTSTPGAGAAFDVDFPIEIVVAEVRHHVADFDLLEEREVPSAARSRGFPGHGERTKPVVMVVEDNLELQKYLQLILEEEYVVIVADNGAEALEKLNNGIACDLILSDMMMPVMDGYQLLEIIKSKESTRGLPVIMLTARAESDDRLKALRIGVDDYLTKPFEDEELIARIRNLLGNCLIRNQEFYDRSNIEKAASKVSDADYVWLERFESYIRKHHADSTLSIPDVAHEFATSESTLLRQLKRLTGLSPLQYIQEVRLNRARAVLENGQYDTVAEVALCVGYKDSRSFSRNFKTRFGKIPSELMSDYQQNVS